MTDTALRDYVFDFLDSSIPADYHFHNLHHTRYVLEKATEIASFEGCSPEDVRLLQAAALLHDTGYTVKHQEHEQESCIIAREILPRFLYSADDIDTICSMIMATRIPQTPKTKLEEILADADLEYLGTDLAEREARLLFQEMASINPAFNNAEWDKQQIKFIGNHRYFTGFCRKNREWKKQDYLLTLIKRTQNDR